PREVRRLGLPERAGRRPYPAVRAHRRGRGRVRRADLRAALQVGLAERAGIRLPALAMRPAFRPAHGRGLPRHAQGSARNPESVGRPAGGPRLMAESAEAAAAAPTGFVARLRARLAARPDTEHEQGILRLVITALGALYLLPDALGHLETWPLYVMLTHFVLSLIIFLRIAYSNEISPARRVFAQFADVAAISWYLGFFGEAGAFLFLLYIWVTLGSGFRFGPKYLISELAMSVVGFGVVIYINEFWRAHLSLG